MMADESETADIPEETLAKLLCLRKLLRDMGSVAVAFSAGVDSTFLLHVAHDELGGRLVAVTIKSHSFPRRELDEAEAFCRAEGVRHEVIETDELSIAGVADNPPDRCYHCKKHLFGKIVAFARENGLSVVAEGANLDDDGDFRPGRRAVRELGVRSPLHEAGLTKEDVRVLSRCMGLPTWRKQSFACLASRFPYGDRITVEALERVERAEQWLMDAGLGLEQLRVRVHGDLARIEVDKGSIPRIAARSGEIATSFNKFGFTYVTLDLQGYRMGSLNDALGGDGRKRALASPCP